MNTRLADLLEEALAQPSEGRMSWISYLPIVKALREKRWEYDRIFRWLIDRGEPLPPDKFKEFRSALSTACTRRRRATERAAVKP